MVSCAMLVVIIHIFITKHCSTMQMEVVDVVGQGIRRLEELGGFPFSVSAIVYKDKECSLHAIIQLVSHNRYQQWILRQILGHISS